jgi:succinate-acetate transporter protein
MTAFISYGLFYTYLFLFIITRDKGGILTTIKILFLGQLAKN